MLHLDAVPSASPSVTNRDPTVDEPLTNHEAMPVEEGRKFASNVWIHNFDFRTPADAAVCAGDAPVLLLGAAGAHAAAAYPEHVECLAVPGEGEQVDLGHALQMLAGRDVHELFIECGATLAGALVAANLVDELVIYMAPRLLGNGARGLVELPGLEHLAQTPMLEIVDVRKLGVDWRMIARPVMPAQAHPKACSPV